MSFSKTVVQRTILIQSSRFPAEHLKQPRAWHKKTTRTFEGSCGFLPSLNIILNQSTFFRTTQYDLKNLVWNGIQKQQPDSIIKKNKIPATFMDWKFGRFFGANVNGMIKHLRSAAK